MKYVIYVVLAISLLWELSFASENFWLETYKTGLGSVMWVAAIIYLYDFSMAMVGKNSEYMMEFYSQLKKDIAVCLASGITLFLLFWSLPTKYSFSNIDLAFLGVPFLFYSSFEIVKSGRLKVANLKMSRKVIWTLIAMLACAYALFYYLLREILTNSFSSMQALWFQITIFFTSLYAFFATNQMRFILEKQRMEISPVLTSLFSSIKSSPSIYSETAENAKQWNEAVKKEKIKIQRIKKQKKKPKR